METDVRSCSLIVAGQRYVGFQFALQADGRYNDRGLLSGPIKVLKRANILRPVQIQFSGDVPREVSFLRISPSGAAYIVVAPKQHQA
jgi:hypothetical protein